MKTTSYNTSKHNFPNEYRLIVAYCYIFWVYPTKPITITAMTITTKDKTIIEVKLISSNVILSSHSILD